MFIICASMIRLIFCYQLLRCSAGTCARACAETNAAVGSSQVKGETRIKLLMGTAIFRGTRESELGLRSCCFNKPTNSY
jgi:hypothetical protein